MKIALFTPNISLVQSRVLPSEFPVRSWLVLSGESLEEPELEAGDVLTILLPTDLADLYHEALKAANIRSLSNRLRACKPFPG